MLYERVGTTRAVFKFHCGNYIPPQNTPLIGIVKFKLSKDKDVYLWADKSEIAWEAYTFAELSAYPNLQEAIPER